MNCSQCLKNLPDWLDQVDAGTLDEAARRELEQQIEVCPECAREWRLALEIRQTLRELPEPAAPLRLRANVRAAIRQSEEPREPLWNNLFPRVRPFVWAGGLGMAALTLWIGVGGQLPTPQPATQTFEAPASDVQIAPPVAQSPAREIPSQRARSSSSTKPKAKPTPAASNPIIQLPPPPAIDSAPLVAPPPPNAVAEPRTSKPAPRAAISSASNRDRAAANTSNSQVSTPKTSSTKPNSAPDVSSMKRSAPAIPAPQKRSSTPPASSRVAPPSVATPREKRSIPAPAVPQPRTELRADAPQMARRVPDSRESSPAPAPLARTGASSTNELDNAGVTLFASVAPDANSVSGFATESRGRSTLSETATAKKRDEDEAAPATQNAPGDAPNRAMRRNSDNAFRANAPRVQPDVLSQASSTKRVRFVLRSRIALPQVELRPIDAPATAAPLWRGDLAANTPVTIDAPLPADAKSPFRLRLEQNIAGARSKSLELSVTLPQP